MPLQIEYAMVHASDLAAIAFLMICLSFSRKCESAFRLRRRERIEVQAPTFLALCFHFPTAFFAWFFEGLWTPM